MLFLDLLLAQKYYYLNYYQFYLIKLIFLINPIILYLILYCKIQSNFTFTMASSGDPSTFTFTMDAFPDYTRFDKTKKVLAAIQIVNELSDSSLVRTRTAHEEAHDAFFID